MTTSTQNKKESDKFKNLLGPTDPKVDAEVREKFPERIIEKAVQGMLPKNKLSADRMGRLKIFAGAEHAHAAQTPKKVEVK